MEEWTVGLVRVEEMDMKTSKQFFSLEFAIVIHSVKYRDDTSVGLNELVYS